MVTQSRWLFATIVEIMLPTVRLARKWLHRSLRSCREGPSYRYLERVIVSD